MAASVVGRGDFNEPTSRTSQVAAGIVLGFLGLPFFLLGLVALFAPSSTSDDPLTYFVAFSAFTLGGAGCLLLSWRLITGRGRAADGGLLSPTALRIWGLLFGAMPIVLLAVGSPLVLESLAFLGAAAACFSLAHLRERHLHKGAGA